MFVSELSTSIRYRVVCGQNVNTDGSSTDSSCSTPSPTPPTSPVTSSAESVDGGKAVSTVGNDVTTTDSSNSAGADRKSATGSKDNDTGSSFNYIIGSVFAYYYHNLSH